MFVLYKYIFHIQKLVTKTIGMGISEAGMNKWHFNLHEEIAFRYEQGHGTNEFRI